ncbi:cobalamin biosynthesis protein [Chelatococcus albus]|uniref:cobalamin biosynthesis protein n=1 Tax=Chelatococcus albus TaxID=3047466 RepID=UPI0024BD5B7F|nr:cobalamin biosynthesis protein [Chelatococcus sp. SYSU_G07232]
MAGFGFRKDATAADLAAVLAMALGRASLTQAEVGALAVPEAKAGKGAAGALAADLGCPVLAVPTAAMQAAAHGCLTRSARSEAAYGVPSVAEAVALAAAGPGARLIRPRVATAKATCAFAQGDGP